MKPQRIQGLVDYVPGLGWVMLSLTASGLDATIKVKRRPRRQYWLVDWSEWHKASSGCQPPQPGIWDAKTGDFTDRYHQDWCRPTSLVKMYAKEA